MTNKTQDLAKQPAGKAKPVFMQWIRHELDADQWGPLGYVEMPNGTQLKVEEEGDSVAPILARDNSTIYWKSVRTLLLSDGTLAYGCADCRFTADKVESVFPHRNVHRGPKSKEAGDEAESPLPTDLAATVDAIVPKRGPGRPRKPVTPADTELANAEAALRLVIHRARAAVNGHSKHDYDKVVDQRDAAIRERNQWMLRAQKAERDLDDIKQAQQVIARMMSK